MARVLVHFSLRRGGFPGAYLRHYSSNRPKIRWSAHAPVYGYLQDFVPVFLYLQSIVNSTAVRSTTIDRVPNLLFHFLALPFILHLTWVGGWGACRIEEVTLMGVKLVCENGEVARFTPHAFFLHPERTDWLLGILRAVDISTDEFANRKAEWRFLSIVTDALNIGVRIRTLRKFI